ncbi:DUF433 domain-containing protein [Bosea sp. LjRoot9]|uniref:DUF433 domain-containing protein n=1 Tax=Bosea sp. LjRoot9 TaxID=3342341 RepID=UPI003F50CA91
MPFLKDTNESRLDLEAARRLVVTSADLLSGTLVIQGTRVPVHDVAASVAAGHSVEHILEAYPSLDREKVRLAVIYVQADPVRDRPRTTRNLPEGAVIIAGRHVRRRR